VEKRCLFFQSNEGTIKPEQASQNIPPTYIRKKVKLRGFKKCKKNIY